MADDELRDRLDDGEGTQGVKAGTKHDLETTSPAGARSRAPASSDTATSTLGCPHRMADDELRDRLDDGEGVQGVEAARSMTSRQPHASRRSKPCTSASMPSSSSRSGFQLSSTCSTCLTC